MYLYIINNLFKYTKSISKKITYIFNKYQCIEISLNKYP